MPWLDLANYFLSKQRLHAWSWINRTFSWEWCFFVGILALNVFGLFLFCFCLVRGKKVTDTQDFGWQSKGEDHFRSWFPFFSCLLGDKFCIVQILFGPKTFLHISFVFFQSLIGDFLSFFFLFAWLGIFPFCFLLILSIGNFLLFSSFLFLFLFSFEGKVYGELGLWRKACRMDGHDICQDVGLVQGSKGMSHIISMTQMQQWWLGNFMQN